MAFASEIGGINAVIGSRNADWSVVVLNLKRLQVQIVGRVKVLGALSFFS